MPSDTSTKPRKKRLESLRRADSIRVSPEEAAPTFATWKHRVEQKEQDLQQEVGRFLELLKVLGTPMVDGTSANFLYYNPQAQNVALAGDFQQRGWMGTPMTALGRTGIFYCTMDVAKQQRIEYKFVVDGRWIEDPLCPNRVENGVGGENSVLMLGDFKEPAELKWHATIPHGRVEQFEFESKILHNRRQIYVYLPPEYDKSSKTLFPALYVQDGGEYLNRARIAVVLDNLLYAREIPPLIGVMIDPVLREPEYRANEDYARFVTDELLPHIEDHYRAQPEREARGVMGASMGGLISTYLGLTRPEVFSKVGGQSSAFFLEEQRIMPLAENLRDNLAFYLDVGQYEMEFIPAHKRLIPVLESKGCTCVYREVPGGHNWTTWRAHLKDLLTTLWTQKKASPEALEKSLPGDTDMSTGSTPRRSPVGAGRNSKE